MHLSLASLHFRSLKAVALGAVAGLLSLAVTAGAQVPAYHAEYLGAAVHVAAMNESGLVVGTGAIGIHPRAYVAGPGKPLTYLPVPFGFISSGATDINDNGVIVGVISPYQTTAFYPQPARWDPNGAGGYTATLLLTLPGDNRGTADAINNLGDIVGTSNYQGNLHTVLYAPTGTVELAGLSGIPARSINDKRVYVGGDYKVHLNTLAVENLGVPGGYDGATTWAINSSGQVAGDLSLSGGAGCTGEAGLYTDGIGWQSVSTCGSSVSSYDLNDLGDVLMQIDGTPFVNFKALGTHKVEDLIVAASGHWTVNNQYNMALNTARQMAVYATNGGQSGIILITPDNTTSCQASIGYGGPGTLHLAMCGGDLSTGTTADLSLTGAAPAGFAYLVASLAFTPLPFKGGTLVPLPVGLVLPMSVGANGMATLAGLPGGHGPFSVYLQAIKQDLNQPLGWALSNAIRADFKP